MSSTILELPEAQMLDYTSDGDYAMHATGHATEWHSMEATMSDDHVPTATEYSETIEIDMDRNDDDEITEYEMADGAEEYDRDEVELVDVDFAESSRVASPITAHHVVDVEELSGQLSFQRAQSSAPLQLLLSPPTQPESIPFPHVEPEVSEQAPTLSVDAMPSRDASPLPPPIASAHEPFASSDQLSVSVEAAQSTKEPPVEDRLGSPAESPPAAALQQVVESLTSLVETEVMSNNLEHGDTASILGQEVPSLRGEEVSAVPIPQPFDEAAQAAGPENTSNPDPNADPHEISDGVYIDPPPPVLLSISSAGRSLDCCLFNQPQSRSGSQSPNAHASKSTAPYVVLLLSQRPTLYYEPLNNVFEALRQENLHGIEGFADAELILDAYELDLRISEVCTQ
jgi:hypothetical protein